MLYENAKVFESKKVKSIFAINGIFLPEFHHKVFFAVLHRLRPFLRLIIFVLLTFEAAEVVENNRIANKAKILQIFYFQKP